MADDALLELAREAVRLVRFAEEFANESIRNGSLQEDRLHADDPPPNSSTDEERQEEQLIAVKHVLRAQRSHFFEMCQVLGELELAKFFVEATGANWPSLRQAYLDWDAAKKRREEEWYRNRAKGVIKGGCVILEINYGIEWDENDLWSYARKHLPAWNENEGEPHERVLARIKNQIHRWARSRGLLINHEWRVLDLRGTFPNGIPQALPSTDDETHVNKSSGNRKLTAKESAEYKKLLKDWRAFRESYKELPDLKQPRVRQGSKKHFATLHAERYKSQPATLLSKLKAALQWEKRNQSPKSSK